MCGQDFFIGQASQIFWAGDPTLGYEPGPQWDNSYSIYSPSQVLGKMEFKSGFYVEAGFGRRIEQLTRRTTGPFDATYFPHSAFTSNSHRRTFYLLDLSTSVGYTYHIDRFGLSGDVGSNFSKVYFMSTKSIDIPRGLQKVKNKSWINERDFMADLQLSLGLSYKLNERIQAQIKLVGRGRWYITVHGDKKARLYNWHPSHGQKYLVGSQVSLAYNLWDSK